MSVGLAVQPHDAIATFAVLLAAAGVLGGPARVGPTLAVAGLMASLFLWSSVQIIGQAREERRTAALAAE